MLAIKQLNIASVWEAWDSGYYDGEFIFVFPVSLFFLQCWWLDEPVEAKEGSYFPATEVFAGLSLIQAFTVGIKKSLYFKVAREDDYIIVFGVNFCSTSIFEIFLSKGLIARFGSDFCLKIVVGTFTEGLLDFLDVILLEGTTHFVFLPYLSTFKILF